jgi:hypothetical protein
MKLIINALAVAAFLCAAACQQKHDHHEVENSPNQALYDEVMGIHDEVMPKMNDLHKAKTALRTRMELPGTSDEEKQTIITRIARIDSASEGMMVWMRQFDPLPDSLGEDNARAYLEQELVKVKKVRRDILQALETSSADK